MGSGDLYSIFSPKVTHETNAFINAHAWTQRLIITISPRTGAVW